MDTTEPAIVVRDVHLRFGRKRVLHEITISQQEALAGKYATPWGHKGRVQLLSVSHRWESPDQPDARSSSCPTSIQKPPTRPRSRWRRRASPSRCTVETKPSPSSSKATSTASPEGSSAWARTATFSISVTTTKAD